ncbi:MAG: pyridoxamine 5'-phosphate oxidase family protein [Acidimicrobiales bacterium]|jgi:hypothetical protein
MAKGAGGGLHDPEDFDGRGSVILSPAECRHLLERAEGGVGRLGTVVAADVTILPLNYVCYDGDLLVRLGPGRLLQALSDEPRVAFEVDHVHVGRSDRPEAWSVLAQGTARLVREPSELSDVSALGLTPLVGEPGEVYVRLCIEHISGRRFPVGALARFQLRRSL